MDTTADAGLLGTERGTVLLRAAVQHPTPYVGRLDESVALLELMEAGFLTPGPAAGAYRVTFAGAQAALDLRDAVRKATTAS